MIIGAAWLCSYGELSEQPQNLQTLKTSVSALNRTSFVRMEPDGAVELTVTNNGPEHLTGLQLECELIDSYGTPLSSSKISLLDLPGNQTQKTYFKLDTSLRNGDYVLKTRVKDKEGVFLSGEELAHLAIVPRPLPLRMPVILINPIVRMMEDEQALKLAKEIGFTLFTEGENFVDYKMIWQAGKLTAPASQKAIEKNRKELNRIAKEELGIVAYVFPGRMYVAEAIRSKYQRIDFGGKPYKEFNVCGLFPEVQAYCYNVGASVAQAYGQFPALQAALIHSEVLDDVQLCFHDHDYAAYRRSSGRKIPAQPTMAWGLDYRSIPDFPEDRVVPDDDPILTYYRWFWRNGNGWNILHTETHRGFKSSGRKDLWTWFEPAVRCPAIYGMGGEVDVVSEWKCTSPDPIQLGRITDELLAMAGGADNPQQVIPDTMIIWYRPAVAVAPQPKAGETNTLHCASWELIETNASYITVAPDHLREAFWSKISRPVGAIMYHGWESLVDTGRKYGYCYTHPETQNVLRELTHNVVQPLGPTLLQVPDVKNDVALLESFTSQMLAGRMYRYDYDQKLYHLMMQYAQLQPDIVYEETILKRGLEGYKVLFMPDCDVLPVAVVKKVKEFQIKGGLIVADEFLSPALTPDILMPSYVRTQEGNQKDKNVLQERAASLRKDLDAFYCRYADSSNPDVIVRVRRYAGTDYVFLVNDRREYGDYVGQHRLVMEKGLPAQSEITLLRPKGVIYDLVAGKEVLAKIKSGKMRFKADLGPGSGGIFMVTDQAIAALKINVPDRVRLGKSISLTVEVNDKENHVLAGAIVPLEIRIINAEGKAAEFSGYYGARDGRTKMKLEIARNDKAGEWKILARELASGKKAEANFQVAP